MHHEEARTPREYSTGRLKRKILIATGKDKNQSVPIATNETTGAIPATERAIAAEDTPGGRGGGGHPKVVFQQGISRKNGAAGDQLFFFQYLVREVYCWKDLEEMDIRLPHVTVVTSTAVIKIFTRV